MEEILVAFGYFVVVATVAMVTIGTLILFVISIKPNFLQRKVPVQSSVTTGGRADGAS